MRMSSNTAKPGHKPGHKPGSDSRSRDLTPTRPPQGDGKAHRWLSHATSGEVGGGDSWIPSRTSHPNRSDFDRLSSEGPLPVPEAHPLPKPRTPPQQNTRRPRIIPDRVVRGILFPRSGRKDGIGRILSIRARVRQQYSNLQGGQPGF